MTNAFGAHEHLGKHLILDLKQCNDNVKYPNGDKISDFSKKLVAELDITSLDEPQVVHFGKEDKTGYTLVQLIDTNYICGHFCDDTGDVYLDIFCSKDFDDNKVIDLVNKSFSPKNIRSTKLSR